MELQDNQMPLVGKDFGKGPAAEIAIKRLIGSGRAPMNRRLSGAHEDGFGPVDGTLYILKQRHVQ